MNFEKMYSTIDTHVAGEAFRIVLHSSIMLNEMNITLNNKKLQSEFQTEKAILLNEPRGHRDMHGCIVVPSRDAHFGLLFFNHDENVQFKYGGLVATITALLETGNLKQCEDHHYTVETIEGIYHLKVTMKNQEVTSVYIESGQCFVQKQVEDYQIVSVDDKRNYALFTSLPSDIPSIDLKYLSQINAWGKRTIDYLMKEQSLEGVIITEAIDGQLDNVRSLTFERDGTILRSPGFDSSFAIFTALRSSHQSIKQISNTSIFNSCFTAFLATEDNQFSIATEGFVTGIHDFIVDQDDPLHDGFVLK